MAREEDGGFGEVRAAIVSVGNELLYGETVDTNAAWIGRTFAEWGIPVVARFTVGDRPEQIREALDRARGAAPLVVVSGGLGPTVDDVTKGAVAEHFGLSLVVDEGVREAVRTRFVAQGFDDIPPLSLGQADVPEGSEALANPEGTAPGILIERDDGYVVLIPGPPNEMRAVVSGALHDALGARGLLGAPVRHRVLHTTGVRETKLAEAVQPLWEALPEPVRAEVGLAFLPDELGVDLRLSARGDHAEAEALFDRVEAHLSEVVDPWRYRAESGDLAEAVADELLRTGRTMATAESCTGGLVAKRMTDRPGSSAYFIGGIVAYDNAVKRSLLGVLEEDLARDGAVSEVVALQMARGAADRLGASCAVSITGVAGPDGGSEEKPVGTVWIGVSLEGSTRASRRQFAGDRGAVRRRSAQAALAELLQTLRGAAPGA